MKINKIDALILVVIVVFVSILVVGFSKDNNASEGKATIEVKVTQNVSDIQDEVTDSVGENVYMNGLKDPIVLLEYENENGALVITFEDTGYEENDTYVYNGQRVLAGQKIELHGKFWAQGTITDINYESN